MTNYFAHLIHAYQPPNQDIKVLKKINDECYQPLFRIIQQFENAKFCLNINGVLVDMLYEFGLGDTMDLIKDLVKQKKIEIVGTGKFHPILPLIPKEEAKRQIHLNEEVNRREFGNNWNKCGFFPPEMAISPAIVDLVRELGYEWIIMSGIACPKSWPYDKIYQSKNGLLLFFRDDILSNKISFKNITIKEFIDHLNNLYKSDNYIIISQDVETYGHHHKHYEKKFLGKVLSKLEKESEICTCFISELKNYFPIEKKGLIPKESSWSTTVQDLKQNIPFPLWKHPKNEVHKFYWKILKSLNKLMELLEGIDKSENWEVEQYSNTARWFYDRSLHSCPTWWANYQRGIWNPNLIYKGMELLIRTALNSRLALIKSGKENGSKGEQYFDSILYYHGLLLMEIMNLNTS